MSVYLIPLQSALLLFPFLAAMITLPYIIMQYRKYGSILPIRVLIVYSFIFYLLCAYFLVVLPLPPIEEVASYTKPIMQLIPFASLKEFTMNSSLIWNDPATYLTALNEPSLYLIVFNILLTVPFGVYLRYYFQCSWKKTLLLTFLLTLSFECLQLSALFGYYPRPYRLFDVDDLITNTLGGMLGYAITPVFAHFLVSRSRMDEKAYDRGRSVSGSRICVFVHSSDTHARQNAGKGSCEDQACNHGWTHTALVSVSASFYDSLRPHPACPVLYFSLCAGLSNAKRCSALDVRSSCAHSGLPIYRDHVSVYPVFVR